MILPAEARPLLDALSPVFTQPTFHRFVILLGSAILTTGRRTVANLAPHRRTADQGAPHHLPAGPLLGRVVRPPPGLPALLGSSWP